MLLPRQWLRLRGIREWLGCKGTVDAAKLEAEYRIKDKYRSFIYRKSQLNDHSPKSLLMI
jgi:hypothetical protein